ncbi:hypothetical protein Tco_0061123, partial [Tanacetum coccineum]
FNIFAVKPPIEELDQFLEFQLPWQGPTYGDLLHAPRPKKNTSLSLQFKVKLENTSQFDLAIGKKRDPKGNVVVVAGIFLGKKYKKGHCIDQTTLI